MLARESLEGQPPMDFESVEQCLEYSLEMELVLTPGFYSQILPYQGERECEFVGQE